MKSFSEIVNKLKDHGYLGETHVSTNDSDKIEDVQEENWGVGVHPYPSADGVDTGNLLDLNDEKTLSQLNAFVGSIAHRDYMDPVVAIRNLQNKLQMVGINFDFNESFLYQDVGNGGMIELPIYRFGVVSGWSKNLDGTYVNGLKTVDEQGGHAFVLEMNLEKLLNGLTSIRAQVRKIV